MKFAFTLAGHTGILYCSDIHTVNSTFTFDHPSTRAGDNEYHALTLVECYDKLMKEGGAHSVRKTNQGISISVDEKNVLLITEA